MYNCTANKIIHQVKRKLTELEESLPATYLTVNMQNI